MLVACLAGVMAISAHVRCLDSAREAARLAARGDAAVAVDVARRIAPSGADVRVLEEGPFVVARVSVQSPMWLGGSIVAEAVAAREPP